MNYTQWTTRTFAIVLLGVFLLGMIFSPRPRAKNIITTKTVEVENPNWKVLKEIDDRGFGYCADGFTIAGEGFTAISEGNTGALEDLVTRMKANTAKIGQVADERTSVLKKLGY